MFKKVLRHLGETTADSLELVLADFGWGRKARRGRRNAYKRLGRKEYARRQYARPRHSHRTKTVVVHVYAGGTVNL